MNAEIIKAKQILSNGEKLIEGAVLHVTEKGKFRLKHINGFEKIKTTYKVIDGELKQYDADGKEIKAEAKKTKSTKQPKG